MNYMVERKKERNGEVIRDIVELNKFPTSYESVEDIRTHYMNSGISVKAIYKIEKVY